VRLTTDFDVSTTTPKRLLITGIILISVGITWPLGIGGSGSVFVFLAGFCCLLAAVVLYLFGKSRSGKSH
jgi:hypothetical protein